MGWDGTRVTQNRDEELEDTGRHVGMLVLLLVAGVKAARYGITRRNGGGYYAASGFGRTTRSLGWRPALRWTRPIGLAHGPTKA